jgi:hypothetical protein
VTLSGAIEVLQLPTYEGSGQAMHPDAAQTPRGWSAHDQHLVLTPYPYGHEVAENPSVYAGDDGLAWSVETGVTNPVAWPRWGHLSDPALVWVPETREMWMYYREAWDSNYVWVVRSPDGQRWGTPQLATAAPNHELISPTVVHRGPGDWQMWSVNGGAGCTAPRTSVERRTSKDGITWSAPEPVVLDQGTYFPWHIDVAWIPSLGQYWAIYNVKMGEQCTTPALFLATSANGFDWTTYPGPVLARGAIPEFADVVYRSTLEYVPQTDMVRFWFSGARWGNQGYVWHIATQLRGRADLFRQIKTPPAHAPAPSRASRPPEAETP